MLDIRRLTKHRFAIVDPYAHDLPADWPLTPLIPDLLQDAQAQLPRLLDLRALGDTRRNALLDADERAMHEGERPRLEFLIDTDADERAVQLHCTNRLVLPRTHNRQALLRYGDPRVMSQLAWMLDAGHLAWLFGPLTRITSRLRGEWITLHAPSPGERHTLIADDALYARLARIGTLNAVIEQYAPSTAWHALEALSRRIEALLERAENEHRLADEASRIAFALQGLHWHAGFDTHPRIRSLIAALDASGDATWRDASALLEDEDWQRIVRELNDAQGAPHG